MVQVCMRERRQKDEGSELGELRADVTLLFRITANLYTMSLYTAAGKAKSGRRTGAHSSAGGGMVGTSNGRGINGGMGQQQQADITEEQRQEVREAFDLFVRRLQQYHRFFEDCF